MRLRERRDQKIERMEVGSYEMVSAASWVEARFHWRGLLGCCFVTKGLMVGVGRQGE